LAFQGSENWNHDVREGNKLKSENWLSPHASVSNRKLVVIILAAIAAMLAVPVVAFGQQETATTADPPKSTVADLRTDPVAPMATSASTYRIGLDDSLLISIWKEPELTSAVVVRPDGMITLPLLNDMRVVGLQPIELQQLLTEKLKPFVSDPQVTVVVTGIKSRKVYLVGQVTKQGEYPLEGGETILQLLATAGGMGPFAKPDSIYILRNENDKQVRIPFKYKKALQGHSMKEDVPLQPGDVVVVP
jgi:polysaccharide biosynthesis/export protein